VLLIEKSLIILNLFSYKFYRRLFELLNDPIILGVHKNNRVQFPAVKIGNWNIPSQLTKCFWTEDGKFNT
jgi:hypothetical protein